MNAPAPDLLGADFVPWPEALAARYRASGIWAGVPLGELIREHAEQSPERIALVDQRQRWSYGELAQRIDRLAAGFWRLGLRASDRVVVQLPNRVEFFAVCFALWRLGVRPVLALPAHRRAEIGAFLEQSEAVAYITVDVYEGFDYRELARTLKPRAPALRHVVVLGDAEDSVALDDLYAEPMTLAPVDAAHVGLYQLSGGTTGKPKLIPRTHDDYLYSVRASAALCRLDADSVYLTVLPQGHNFPLTSPGALGCLSVGGRVVMAGSGAPEVAFGLIAEEGVTITALVPPLAMVWLEAARHRREMLASLRLLQVGGAKLGESVARRVRPELGCKLQQVFGMAEGLLNYTRLTDPEELIVTTQGRPLSPEDEVLIVDDDDQPLPDGVVGNLLTRGPYTIRGYFRAAAHNALAFTADGFYRTGDRARVLPSGHLVVEGRSKEQINRGGEKIAPEEVENALLAHPAIQAAALVGIPDPFLGERACAFLVAGDAASPLGHAEVRAHLRAQGLAELKLPDRSIWLPELPRTGVGKIDKQALAALVAATGASATAAAEGDGLAQPEHD